VIPSFVDRAIRGEPLTIAGTGEQGRSFVYVEDLAEGVVRALRPEAAGRTYNLASQETTTVRELAEIVRAEVGPTEIVHTEGRAGDLRGARVSSDRAAAELGWTAATPLREGVRRYAQWIRAQDTPAATEAVAPTARTGRNVLARLAGAISDPIFAGLAAMIAVASAAVSVTLAATDQAQAAALTVSSLALMLPLWALTVTPWPDRLRRTQALLAAAGGAFGVILLGLLSGDGDAQGDLHGYGLMWLVILSGCVGAALRIVPRRSADTSA
jgi:UDP-glucose 4-epimerase